MDQYRQGETGNVPFRTGRIFNVGMEWFFMTREGIDRGPYVDKQDAEVGLTLFIRAQHMVDERLIDD